MTVFDVIDALKKSGHSEAVAIGQFLEDSDDTSREMVMAMLAEIIDWAQWARDQLQDNLDKMEDSLG